MQSEIRRWTHAFRMRHDANNIDTYRIEDIKNWNEVRQNIITQGLFSEKRLFIISGTLPKKSKTNDTEEQIIHICEDIPEDHFILFMHLALDEKKSQLLPWLEQYADIRIFDSLFVTKIWQERFPELASETIQIILDRYKKSEQNNESTNSELSILIAHSLEKLSLLQASSPISESMIEASLSTESYGKIFDFIDAIGAMNHTKALTLFHILIEHMSVYEFLNSIIGLLRPTLYVKYLVSKGKKEEIARITRMHPYVMKKSIESRIDYETFREFYAKIIDTSIAYKSGK